MGPKTNLNILRHDGDTLGMDGTKVGVLKKADQVGLGSLLQENDPRLESPQSQCEAKKGSFKSPRPFDTATVPPL